MNKIKKHIGFVLIWEIPNSTKTRNEQDNTKKEQKYSHVILSWKHIITSYLYLVLFLDHLHVFPNSGFRLYQHRRTMIFPQRPCSQAGSNHVPSLLLHCCHFHCCYLQVAFLCGIIAKATQITTQRKTDIWQHKDRGLSKLWNKPNCCCCCWG